MPHARPSPPGDRASSQEPPPGSETRSLIGECHAEDLVDRGQSRGNLVEPALAEGPHSTLDGQFLEFAGGPLAYDRLLDLRRQPHDLVDGDATLEAGLGTRRAALARVGLNALRFVGRETDVDEGGDGHTDHLPALETDPAHEP